MRRAYGLATVLAWAFALSGRADDLYNTMGMISDSTYDTGNGNAISGMGAFGAIYDLQAADDFHVPTGGFKINEMAQGSIAFFGRAPQDLAIRIYGDAGGKPNEDAIFEALAVTDLGLTLTTTNFEDKVFGYVGVTLTVGGLNIDLGEGTYWINLQPIDLSEGGDWYYQARDLDSATGGDGHVRDGKSGYPGGYDAPQWTSSGAGDYAMRISGQVPEPATIALMIVGAIAARRRA